MLMEARLEAPGEQLGNYRKQKEEQTGGAYVNRTLLTKCVGSSAESVGDRKGRF